MRLIVFFTIVLVISYSLWDTMTLHATPNLDLSAASMLQINDSCSASITISCGDTILGSTFGTTPEPGIGVCVTPLTTAGGLWYNMLGNGYPIIISLCNSNYDTKVGVFTGPCGALNCVIGVDDVCQLQSEVMFNSVSGTNYFIYVTGFANHVGDFVLAVTCLINGCTDVNANNYDLNATVDDGSCSYIVLNDTCKDAFTVLCGDTLSGSLTEVSNFGIPSDNCGLQPEERGGSWFKFTGNGDSITLSACGTGFEATLILYESAESACDSLICLQNVVDSCQSNAALHFLSDSGANYYLYLTGSDSINSNYTLTANCIPALCALVPVVTANNITTSSMTLNWDPIPNAVAYKLIGSRIGLPSINPFTLGNINSFSLAGLTVGACYNWQLAAVCDQAANIESEYSEMDTFCLLSTCAAPDSIYESSLMPTEVILNWTAVNGADSYRIYGRVLGNSQIVTFVINDGAQNNLTVSNLVPGQSYEWAAQSVCVGLGFSGISTISSFTLPVN